MPKRRAHNDIFHLCLNTSKFEQCWTLHVLHVYMYKHSRKNSAGLSGNFTKLMCLRTFKWNIKTLNETKSSPKNHTTSLPQGVLSADYSNTLGRKIFVDMKFLLQKCYLRIDHCYTASICKNELICLYIAMVHPRIFLTANISHSTAQQQGRQHTVTA